MIVSLLKKFSKIHNLDKLNEKLYNDFLSKDFNNQNNILDFLKFLKFTKVGEVQRYLIEDKKHLELFKNLDLDKLLNTKIRITVNALETITQLNEEMDEYQTGTLIANANNQTQNVKVDDIFGSKYKKELEEYIFKDFINQYKNSTKIEYRLGEIIEKGNKVHILTLLRPVVSTGIITKDAQIFKLSNQRAPVYSLFMKLLTNKTKASKTIDAISKIIPLLYHIRVTYVQNQLELQNKPYYREYIEKAINKELADTSIRDRIKTEKGKLTEDTEKVIKNIVSHNIEHIFPVVVYRIRNLIKIGSNNKVEIVIPQNKEEEFFKSITNSIYKKYIDAKLVGTTGSMTDTVRNPNFFKSGEEAYEVCKNMMNLKETTYIKENSFLINI